MAGTTTKTNLTSLLTNSTASICLALLLALGIYVNTQTFVLGSDPTPGYRVLHIDSTYWNVGATILGTAVGLLSIIAFTNQDDQLTRIELARPERGGVKAMFLRPLSMKRGFEQVWRLQFPLVRSLLVFLSLVTALTSAATVALFGVRPVRVEVVNPESSVPLAGLNRTLFINGPGGGVFPAGQPSRSPQISPLSGFLYRAAYITGLKRRDRYSAFDLYTAFLPEQGAVGDTIYANLSTGGIGLNVSSYLQYSGSPSNFDLPARYEFEGLGARVYGTHVNVSCANATNRYTLSQDYFAPYELDVGAVKGPNGKNITFTKTLDDDYILTIGSTISIDQESQDPTLLLLMPSIGIHSVLALECTYSGREYTAEVSVASATSPLVVDREIQQDPFLGPAVKGAMANVTQRLLASGSKGGGLAQGFIDAEFHADGADTTDGDLVEAVETVLGMVGEAYVSLQRQQAERLNIDKSGSKDPYDSPLRLNITIQRLGGGQFGWLAVLGVLLIGTLLGTVRSCVGRTRADFEAQDAVKLMRFVLRDDGIRDTTRVMQRDGIVVLGKTEPGLDSSVEGEKIGNS